MKYSFCDMLSIVKAKCLVMPAWPQQTVGWCLMLDLPMQRHSQTTTLATTFRPDFLHYYSTTLTHHSNKTCPPTSTHGGQTTASPPTTCWSVRNNSCPHVRDKWLFTRASKQSLPALSDDCEIIALHRAYDKHAQDSNYQMRIVDRKQQ